jgi:hypothetical protein
MKHLCSVARQCLVESFKGGFHKLLIYQSPHNMATLISYRECLVMHIDNRILNSNVPGTVQLLYH